jgi:hypothetical protein
MPACLPFPNCCLPIPVCLSCLFGLHDFQLLVVCLTVIPILQTCLPAFTFLLTFLPSLSSFCLPSPSYQPAFIFLPDFLLSFPDRLPSLFCFFPDFIPFPFCLHSYPAACLQIPASVLTFHPFSLPACMPPLPVLSACLPLATCLPSFRTMLA